MLELATSRAPCMTTPTTQLHPRFHPCVTIYSDTDFEPAAPSVDEPEEDHDIEVPAFVDDEQVRHERERGHLKTESTTLPPNLDMSLPESQSKTAALIKMYREKEKQTTASPIASPTPSRLPVRMTLSNKDQPPIPGLSATQPLPPTPPRSDAAPLDPPQIESF